MNLILGFAGRVSSDSGGSKLEWLSDVTMEEEQRR